MAAEMILNIQEDKPSWERMVHFLESLPEEAHTNELYAMVQAYVQGYCIGLKHAQETEVPKKPA